MAEYLVDVVAAAARLEEAQRAQESTEAEATVNCPLDHPNVSSAKFCADCGMPLENLELTSRVDLDAVRSAVQRPLTAEEKAEREREHARVMAANLLAEQQARDVTKMEDPSEKQVLIHFVEDGLTWGGKVWQRGEMLQLGPQHPMWKDALGWIRLTKQQQFQRWGRIFFDFGPWPGTAPPAGAEIPLGTATPARWAHQGSVPATFSTDGSQSLIPR